MKNIFTVFILLFAATSYGQIKSVTLQASGLTCSMCSRAIYKSLQKVPSVDKVQEDIEHSSYHIQFKDSRNISLIDLKKAIIDAGFSVARMEITADFKNEPVGIDSTLKLNDLVFHFVDISNQTLNGEQKLLVLDKDYLLEKERKKYAVSGEKDFNSSTAGNYYVTLSKS